MGRAQRGSVEVGAAELTNLPRGDEGLQCRNGVFEGSGGVGKVQLVEIDVVGAEPAKRRFAGRGDVVGVGTPLDVGKAFVETHAEFRGNGDGCSARTQGTTQKDLRLGLAVGVGGVKEGDAVVEGGVHHVVSAGLIESNAEVVAAQTDG